MFLPRLLHFVVTWESSIGTDRAANVTLLDELRQELCLEGDETSEVEGQESTGRLAYVTSLNAGECPNIMSAMKALIGGFVDIPPNGIESGCQSLCSVRVARDRLLDQRSLNAKPQRHLRLTISIFS